MSWKSSSLTAVPFDQAAHSQSNLNFEFTPNKVAPFFLECLRAISLEEITDFLFNDAIATDALSIILLITISIASLFNLALSLAISAIFHASWFFFGRLILDGDKKKSIMIGDSESDANAAKAAEIPMILLKDGYSE